MTQIIIDPGVIANQYSSYLFGHLKNLQKITGLANLDTANVTNMAGIFGDCSKLTSLDLSNWDTTSLDENQFGAIFLGAIKLNHLVLGARTVIGDNLPGVPNVGTRVPGTDWVATSGYQQENKYTSTE
ncbi:Uncharacterized protein JG30_06400 [Bombilactobacillus mellifer]|uniref:BspA family leucine-rich repeat surface protein n=1 Tax=Bombilactobacillus mellifer TaxID=1218492 RepID=A0A0F4LVW3_9LACO|nr:BspA family leucine-rich repeat surface protein [Bombilactobacillus mellifer]KJY62429.1 Uncharacterized protein JG30_06400 [Bombilactobacillus mellifer]